MFSAFWSLLYLPQAPRSLTVHTVFKNSCIDRLFSTENLLYYLVSKKKIIIIIIIGKDCLLLKDPGFGGSESE